MFRRNRNLFVRLLSLAFLCAQFGMLAHASTHLKVDPHNATTAQLCSECLCSGPLQNMVGGTATVILQVKATNNRVLDAVAFESIPSRAFTAFRSRAPPNFL